MREKETSEGPETADREGRRTRRHDPRRRERVLDAALDVLAEDGVSGIPHRKVAARADVPLGSVSNHFASLTELCTRAFARYVEQRSTEYEALFAEVTSREDLIEVLVERVRGGPSRHRSAVLGFELHLAALRDPALRALTQEGNRVRRSGQPS
ncbi:TetR family transcriptional regulator [Streptomyces canus]|uniref:TetR/AcrR family transcriptional regulator n=1 Tax=Streptomyces canus TaxID=58343 RepID=UPI0033F09C70